MLKESDQNDQEDQSTVDELIFENKNINALIKGVEDDIETLKKEHQETGGRSSDIVRFTIELNVLKDKRDRNLKAITNIIESRKK